MSDYDSRSCLSCSIQITEAIFGVSCPSGHSFCLLCTQKFISTVFESPLTTIPARCAHCAEILPSEEFKMCLDSTQLKIYNLYVDEQSLDYDIKIQRCPHCQYYEKWEKSSTETVFYCKNTDCNKHTCVICYKPVRNINSPVIALAENLKNMALNEKEPESEDVESKASSKDMDSEEEFCNSECNLLYDYKKMIEKTIKQALRRRCPNCKLGGRKDDACTHMTCPKCYTTWCYFCGLEESECDKGDDQSSMFGHNEMWQSNSQRCPMYFTDIAEIDCNWGYTDEMCLDMFHESLLKRALKIKWQEIGEEIFLKTFLQFGSIQNCGVSLEDIENFDLDAELIQRN
jgi:hypothetical protein